VSNYVPFAANHIHTRANTWLCVRDKMAGGPTQSRDNIDYCRLDTRFLFVRFASHFLTSHQSEVRALVRTPPGQISGGTALTIYRTHSDFLNEGSFDLFRGRINAFSQLQTLSGPVYTPLFFSPLHTSPNSRKFSFIFCSLNIPDFICNCQCWKQAKCVSQIILF
jgi:hypothetical protein